MAIIKEEVTEKYRDGTTKTYVKTDILGTTVSNTADTISNLGSLAIYAYMKNIFSDAVISCLTIKFKLSSKSLHLDFKIPYSRVSC